MRWLFASGGQNIGVSALAPVLPVNIQDWFPLGLTGLISLLSKGSQESYPAPQFKRIDSLALSLLYVPTLISVCDYRKTIALTLWTFVGKVMSLLFNMLSRFVKLLLRHSSFPWEGLLRFIIYPETLLSLSRCLKINLYIIFKNLLLCTRVVSPWTQEMCLL